MARPTSKETLIAADAVGYANLLELIDSILESTRNDAFNFEGRDRNIKDVVCHLYEWQMLVVRWYGAQTSGQDVKFLPGNHTWRTTPALNEEFWLMHSETTLEQALALLDESHCEICSLIESHTDEELFTKKYYPWTGTTSLGAYFVSATSSHYDWASKKIKKFKKSL